MPAKSKGTIVIIFQNQLGADCPNLVARAIDRNRIARSIRLGDRLPPDLNFT